MIRTAFRLFKTAVFIYGLWNAWKNSRWLTTAAALWRMLQKRPDQDTNRKAQMVFVSAMEPAIYQRKGWRKLSSKRTPI